MVAIHCLVIGLVGRRKGRWSDRSCRDELLSRQMPKQHLGIETKDDGLDAQVAASLGEICAVLHHHTGHDFSHYKEGTLLRRIRRRIQLQHQGSVAEYVKKLENDAVEVASLLKEFLIGVTQFFRDPEAFQALG